MAPKPTPYTCPTKQRVFSLHTYSLPQAADRQIAHCNTTPHGILASDGPSTGFLLSSPPPRIRSSWPGGLNRWARIRRGRKHLGLAGRPVSGRPETAVLTRVVLCIGPICARSADEDCSSIASAIA